MIVIDEKHISKLKWFSSVKFWKFSEILNIDIMLYYMLYCTFIHCLLTLYASNKET